MSNEISTMSLLQFKGTRRMVVAPFVNKESGENFKSCVFINGEGEKEFVHFSSKLGELTPAEIAASKHNLQVATLPSGNKVLCRRGEGAWEEVDI